MSLALLGLTLVATGIRARGGRGPVFYLATPVLPQGVWNADLTLMSTARGEWA